MISKIIILKILNDYLPVAVLQNADLRDPFHWNKCDTFIWEEETPIENILRDGFTFNKAIK